MRRLPLMLVPLLALPLLAQASVAGTQMAELARGYLGVPYRYGGATPAGFDCSGLIYHVHERVGQRIPRTVHAQYLAAKPVQPGALRAGDLVFFAVRSRTHVGIYLGNGHFVHAPSRGKRVREQQLASPFWRARFIGAGRFAPAPA